MHSFVAVGYSSEPTGGKDVLNLRCLSVDVVGIEICDGEVVELVPVVSLNLPVSGLPKAVAVELSD